jgi:hypothetical protein
MIIHEADAPHRPEDEPVVRTGHDEARGMGAFGAVHSAIAVW